MEVFPEGSYEKFAEVSKNYLSKELREEAMTIAQQLQQKGIQQGVDQGLHQVALNMLREGMSINMIARATTLSEEEIERLKTESETKH